MFLKDGRMSTLANLLLETSVVAARKIMSQA